jgi:hypothetical protein
MYIGTQAKTILGTIIPNIIQRNITKICLKNVLRGCAKLLQPQPPTRTDTQTVQRTLRATHARAALSHAYDTTYQNRITDIL